MAFKMKGFSPFTAKKTRKVSGKRPKNSPPPPDHKKQARQFNTGNTAASANSMLLKTGEKSPMEIKRAPAAHTIYDSGEMARESAERIDKFDELAKKKKKKKKSSAMKLKTVPAIPRKGKKSPADRVADLTAKEKAGTLTSTEKKELRKLKRSMERGSGSYGREEYDKE